jgi:hypothetical protein
MANSPENSDQKLCNNFLFPSVTSSYLILCFIQTLGEQGCFIKGEVPFFFYMPKKPTVLWLGTETFVKQNVQLSNLPFLFISHTTRLSSANYRPWSRLISPEIVATISLHFLLSKEVKVKVKVMVKVKVRVKVKVKVKVK